MSDYTTPGTAIPVDIQTTQELVNQLTRACATIRALAGALENVTEYSASATQALAEHKEEIDKAKGSV